VTPITRTARTAERPRYLLRRAQDVLHASLTAAFREHGATVAQYAILVLLDEEPGLSNADLARRAFLTPQTMNQTLRSLEEKRWVTRRPHPVHGRILQASLTPDGRTALLTCQETADVIEEQMLSLLSAEERQQLEVALRACVRALTPGER
jgi:DNA-binding MarR family transcriptional regulator